MSVCLSGRGKGEMNCKSVCETRRISVDCGGKALLLSLCIIFPGFVRGHLLVFGPF